MTKSGQFWSQCFLPSLVIRKATGRRGQIEPGPPVAAQCGLKCMAKPNTCTRMHNAFELCCCRADALAFTPMQQHSLCILISIFKSFERKSCIDE